MIYCLGKKRLYDKYIKEDENACKAGRSDDHVGGSVWETIEDAEQYLEEGYAVYGVLSDWEKDTELSKDGSWHDLLIDSKLVFLGEK